MESRALNIGNIFKLALVALFFLPLFAPFYAEEKVKELYEYGYLMFELETGAFVMSMFIAGVIAFQRYGFLNIVAIKNIFSLEFYTAGAIGLTLIAYKNKEEGYLVMEVFATLLLFITLTAITAYKRKRAYNQISPLNAGDIKNLFFNRR